MKDFYSILGIDSNCTTAEIKDAYRKLSKKFHPDLNQGDKYFENRFREINEAYEILHDPDKRFRYDNLKKVKLKDSASEHKQEPAPAPVQPKSKRSGTLFTVTLAVICTILGIYLIRSFDNSKKMRTAKDPVITVPAHKIHKHHKIKYILKTKTNTDSSKRQAKVPVTKITTPMPVIQVKPSTVVDKTIQNNKEGYLYATYVKANPTHIINMRQSDNFDSDIIEKIPDNSQVYVLQRGDFYYRVSYNNYIGYIPKWSLQER